MEKHSFFYQDNGEKEFMVSIDGSIFFYGDEDSEEETGPSNTATNPAGKEETTSEAFTSKGFTILNKVKQVHGGEALDKVRTVSATFTT